MKYLAWKTLGGWEGGGHFGDQCVYKDYIKM